jgi:hypothetical protein
MRCLAAVVLILAASGAMAYDVNGVALGGAEVEVRKKFPSARCQGLEWKSKAADRRCDDAKIAFAGGVAGRITFYLKGDAIQAFDIRFDTRDLERVAGFLKKQYGEPLAESRDTIERQDKNPVKFYKVRWEKKANGKGRDQAVLVSQLEKSKSSLLVSRGDFEEEIYRVR